MVGAPAGLRGLGGRRTGVEFEFAETAHAWWDEKEPASAATANEIPVRQTRNPRFSAVGAGSG